MESQDILALFDRFQRVEIEYPQMQKEYTERLVRFVRPAPGSSYISYSRLDSDCAEAEIEQQLAFFQGNRLPFSWKVFAHDAPADLKERLAARGLKVYEQEDVMVLDLEKVPASLLKAPQELLRPGCGAELRAITRPEELLDVQAVLEEVWNADFNWIHERLGNSLMIPGYLMVVCASIGDQPVSTGWMYLHPNNPFANLHGGSTLAEARGQGLYTALLAMRAQEALRRGYRFLTIDAGPMSGPIVRKHGFELLTHAWDCDWEIPKEEDNEPLNS
jgi:hypothetical protein